MEMDLNQQDALMMPLDSFGPLTESQQEIFAACQLGREASLAYNESVTLCIDGAVDPVAMQKALQALRLRHGSLRMIFAGDGSGFFIKTEGDASQDVYQAPDAVNPGLDAWKLHAVSEPFDLIEGPLFRATILPGSQQSHVILAAHHIICDGWSIAIMMRDLAKLYSSCVQGISIDLPAAPSFADFAQDALEYGESVAAAADLEYWIQSLTRVAGQSASLPAMDLPHDKPRPKFRTFASKRIDVEIAPELLKSLKSLAARERSSLLMALLTSYKILLWKILDDDVVVATPAAAQAHGLYDLVAHAVHTMPIRTHLSGNDSFRSVLRSVRSSILDANDHQRCTYGRILQSLPLERDSSRIPLAPILFNVDRKFDESELGFAGLKASYDSNPRICEAFELFHNITESQGSARIECQFNADLYSDSWIQSHLDSFITVLQSIVRSPDASLGDLIWAPQAQLDQLFFEWNAPYTAVEGADFLSLFDQQAAKFPSRKAVIAQDRFLSYQELLALSNQWASLLQQQGVARGQFVGVAMERRSEILACLLGIMKAGAAYVPMDPNYPKDRLAYMVEHAQIKLVISERSVASELPLPADCQALTIEDCTERLQRCSSAQPVSQRLIEAHDPAYVIFTSGSTGSPKGVVVSHGGVLNFLEGMQKKPGLEAGETLLSVTTLSFDIAVLELYLPLIAGATIILATRDQAIDGFALRSILENSQVSCMQATPATWRMLLDSGWQGSKLKALVGGEALPYDLAEKLLPSVDSLWNMYGPTETTVWSTCRRIESADAIDIGFPIQNTSIYLLDRFGQHVPWGIPGELYIGGMGVSLGYLRREDLTQERFVQISGVPDTGRVYRTGDLVRLDAKGSLHYIRRNDNQVKLRGFRIELGEIESALIRHPEVKAAVVLVREDTVGDARLTAYATVSAAAPGTDDLLRWLREHLPAYMVPQHVLILETLPLLPNGKIDRKSLPKPGQTESVTLGGCEPRPGLEQTIADLWAEILGLQFVPSDSSFYSLGGHSLLAIRMLQKLQVLSGKVITLKTLMENSTIQQLAHALDGSQSDLKPIPVETNGQRGPLSLMQERVYFLDRLSPLESVHILPDGRKIEGALQPELFLKAIDLIIQRHPQMRARVVETEAGPELCILDSVPWDRTLMDLSQLSEREREETLAAEMKAIAQKPMIITQDLLFRIKLFKLAENSFVLGTGFHHIVWDGWCFDIFWTDLHTLYHELIGVPTGRTLPQISANYLDFSVWHRKQSQSPETITYQEFWSEYLKDLELLELPTDLPRPIKRSNQGQRMEFQWPPELVAALENLGRKDQATSFVVMLALFKLLLADLTGQADTQIGTPVQGRDHPDLSHMIGYFVNTLLVRTKVNLEINFREHLRLVKNSLEGAIRHQDVPFEKILANLSVRPDPSRTSLYTVMFGYQDTSNRLNDWQGIQMKQFSLVQDSVGSDLMLWMRKNSRGIEGGFDFRSDLFSSQRVELWIQDLTLLAQAVLVNAEQPLGQLLQKTFVQDLPGPRSLHKPALTAWSHAPELVIGNERLPSEIYQARFQEARAILLAEPQKRLLVSLDEPELTLPFFHAALVLNRSVKIAVSSREQPSASLEAQPGSAAACSSLPAGCCLEEWVSPATTATMEFPDGTSVAFDLARESAQFSSWKHILTPDAAFHIDLNYPGPQQIFWLLQGLVSGSTLVLHRERRSSSHHLLAAWNKRRSGHAFLTLGELVNLLVRGWQPSADLTLIVGLLESMPGEALLRTVLARKNRVLFAIPAEPALGYLAVAEPSPEDHRLNWRALLGELSVTHSDASQKPKYRRGWLTSSIQGTSQWWAEKRGSDLQVFCKNPGQHLDGGLLARDEDQHMLLQGLSDVLYACLDRSEESGSNRAFVVCQTLDHQRLLQARQDIAGHGPRYLRPESVIIADHLPLRSGGHLDREQIRALIDQETKDQSEAPRTFAEKCLRDIWAKVLGRNDIIRHSNFFELGGHSLLPLLVINRIEAQTGKRLDLGLFLTQSLAGLAPHCGFKEESGTEECDSAKSSAGDTEMMGI